jgi:hypothetical protein
MAKEVLYQNSLENNVSKFQKIFQQKSSTTLTPIILDLFQ